MRAHDLVEEGQVPESSDHGGLLVSSETSNPTLNTSWHGGRLMGRVVSLEPGVPSSNPAIDYRLIYCSTPECTAGRIISSF